MNENSIITCKDCGAEYTKDDKQMYVPYRSNMCRECYNDHMREVMRKRITKDIYSYFRYAIASIRNKKNGSYEVSIDEEYLARLYEEQNGLCKITKIPLMMNHGKGQLYNSISIDRIDNNIDYVEGNIQIVCHGFNSMKSNHDDETFKILLEGAYDYYYKTS